MDGLFRGGGSPVLARGGAAPPTVLAQEPTARRPSSRPTHRIVRGPGSDGVFGDRHARTDWEHG